MGFVQIRQVNKSLRRLIKMPHNADPQQLVLHRHDGWRIWSWIDISRRIDEKSVHLFIRVLRLMSPIVFVCIVGRRSDKVCHFVIPHNCMLHCPLLLLSRPHRPGGVMSHAAVGAWLHRAHSFFSAPAGLTPRFLSISSSGSAHTVYSGKGTCSVARCSIS
jgi:hypothetical protein